MNPVVDKKLIEERIASLPIYQYEFFSASELVFEPKVRQICRSECPMYGRSWSCPPAVGTFDQCRERCLSYGEAMLLVTAAEVDDTSDMASTLPTRRQHEAITRQVRGVFTQLGCETFVLSSEACAACERCSWPDAQCRHPERMFPCIESHCILVTQLAERFGIEFLPDPGTVMWFSIILF